MENLTPTLTNDEVLASEQKAIEIAKEKGVPRVHPFIFIHQSTYRRIHAFLREPTLTEKVYALDNVSRVGMNTAALMLSEQLVIKEHTDQLVYGDTFECEPYKLGVMQGVIERIIEVYVDQYNVTKKNMKLREQAEAKNSQ